VNAALKATLDRKSWKQSHTVILTEDEREGAQLAKEATQWAIFVIRRPIGHTHTNQTHSILYCVASGQYWVMWELRTHLCLPSQKWDTYLIADIKIIKALMG